MTTMFKKLMNAQPELEPGEHPWIAGGALMDRWGLTADQLLQLSWGDVLTAFSEDDDGPYMAVEAGRVTFLGPVDWTDIDLFSWAQTADPADVVTRLFYRTVRVKQLEAHLKRKPGTGGHWEAKRQQVRDAADQLLEEGADAFRKPDGSINAAYLADEVLNFEFRLFPDNKCPMARPSVYSVLLSHVKR